MLELKSRAKAKIQLRPVGHIVLALSRTTSQMRVYLEYKNTNVQ